MIARWLERRTRDQKLAGSSPGGSEGGFFFGGEGGGFPRSASRADSFRYPFHPSVIAVAHKNNKK